MNIPETHGIEVAHKPVRRDKVMEQAKDVHVSAVIIFYYNSKYYYDVTHENEVSSDDFFDLYAKNVIVKYSDGSTMQPTGVDKDGAFIFPVTSEPVVPTVDATALVLVYDSEINGYKLPDGADMDDIVADFANGKVVVPYLIRENNYMILGNLNIAFVEESYTANITWVTEESSTIVLNSVVYNATLGGFVYPEG